MSDAERWDARYEGRVGRAVAPLPPIALQHADDVALADFPIEGFALDVACGLGAQSLWLAERGLRVEALDVSGTAIDAVRRSASIAGFADRISADVDDLDHGLPAAPGSLDVLVCQRFRAPHLYEAFLDSLRTGGWLVMTILSETGADDPGEFHAPPGELTLFFDRPGCRLVAHHEGDGEESIVVRRSR